MDTSYLLGVLFVSSILASFRFGYQALAYVAIAVYWHYKTGADLPTLFLFSFSVVAFVYLAGAIDATRSGSK